MRKKFSLMNLYYLKLGYYDFEKEKAQKVKFSLEIDYQDKSPQTIKILGPL